MIRTLEHVAFGTAVAILFGTILIATPVLAASEVSGTLSSIATSTSGGLSGTVGGGSSATGTIDGTAGGGSLSGTVTGGGGGSISIGNGPPFSFGNGVGGEGAVLGAAITPTGSVLGAETVNVPNTGMGANAVPLLGILALLSIAGFGALFRFRS